MHFVPIPTTEKALRDSSQHWLPFLPMIAKRSKESIEQLLDRIVSGYTEIALIWDDDKVEAQALIGIQYVKCGDELVGEITWTAGRGMREWEHLVSEVERYLRERMHCAIMRPVCRPGWSRMMKNHGYRTTHYVMEKRL